MYYSVLGTVITIVVGTLVSWWTATEDDVCDEKMLNPYFVQVMHFFRRRRLSREAAKDAAAQVTASTSISSIEAQFVELQPHTNLGFEFSPSIGVLNKLSAKKDASEMMVQELQPYETYRKIEETA